MEYSDLTKATATCASKSVLSCNAGFGFLDGGAYSDNSCNACSGSYYQPNDGSTNACTSWSNCGDGQYLSGSPDATEDGTCTPCLSGTAKAGTSTATSCSACSSETFSLGGAATCTAWTSCPAGQYLAGASATQDGTCTPCASGEWSSGGTVAQCTAHSSPTCDADEVVIAGTSIADAYCACDAGYHVDTSNVAAAEQGSETLVNTHTTDNQELPSVAMHEDGSYVVVWQSKNQVSSSSGYDVYGQRYKADGTPEYKADGTTPDEFLVNTITTGDQEHPSVTFLSNGKSVAVWQSHTGSAGSYYNIYARLYAADGTAEGSQFLVNTHTSNHKIEPSVAALDEGTFVMVWQSYGQDGASYGVYAQRYKADGTTEGSEFLVNTETTYMQQEPSVDHLGSGKFVVTWESYGQDASNTWGIYAQRYKADGTPEYKADGTTPDEFRVNTETTNNQQDPSVAALDAGKFVIAWVSSGQDGSSVGVYAQRYKADGTTEGLEFLVNTHTTDSQNFPSVAGLGSDRFVIAWQSYGQDASNTNGIYAKVYEDGAVVADEFLVNEYTTGHQEYPTVAGSSDGKFVVAWESQNQVSSNSAEDIYFQRYFFGKQPIAGSMLCAECAAGAVRPAGDVKSSLALTTCDTCSAGSEPNAEDSACVCKDGHSFFDGAGTFSTPTLAECQSTELQTIIHAQWAAMYPDRILGTLPFFSGAFNNLPYGCFFYNHNTEDLNNRIGYNSNTADTDDVSGSGTSFSNRICKVGSNFLLVEPTVKCSTIPAQCNLCAAGTYRAGGDSLTGNATTCEACPPETYSSAESASCTPWTTCAAGLYLAGRDATQDGTCTPCPAGSFQSSADSTAAACTACPAGEYIGTTGASSCLPCASGTFSTGGAEECLEHYLCSANSTEETAPTSSNDRVCACEAGHSYLEEAKRTRAEERVSTSETSNQLFPSVAALENGKYVVAWYSDGQASGTSANDIYAQRYAADGTKDSTEFRVNTETSNDQTAPSVAHVGSGKFVVTWASKNQVSSTSDNDIYAQIYEADGSKQGGEFRVNDYTTGTQTEPFVAGLGSGKFVVTWHSNEQDGSKYGVYAQRFLASGTKDGSEFLVNTETDSDQWLPAIAHLGSGKFVVAWGSYNQDGSSMGVYARRFKADGTTEGSEFLVNNYTTNSQSNPYIAHLGYGKFVVVWYSVNQVSSSSSYDIYAQRYAADGTKDGSEFLVNDYTTGHQQYPSVAALDAGKFVVTWMSDGQDGSNYGVYAQMYKADGTALLEEFLVNSATTGHQDYASVAGLGNDAFVIAYHSPDSDSRGIFKVDFKFERSGCTGCAAGTSRAGGDLSSGAVTTCAPCLAGEYAPATAASCTACAGDTYSTGGAAECTAQSCPTGYEISVDQGAIAADVCEKCSNGYHLDTSNVLTSYTNEGSETRVSTETTSHQQKPSVAFLSNGMSVVVWDSYNQVSGSSKHDIYAQLYRADNTKQGSEFLVNTHTTNSQLTPSVAALGSGKFVVVWRSENQVSGSSDYDIYAQIYEADGSKQGGEFLVNTYTTSWQTDPSVAALDAGKFVIAWSSLNQVSSTSDYDVYAQRYAADGTEDGNEFRVNSYMAAAQQYASVAALDAGKFVVTWQSYRRHYYYDSTSWSSKESYNDGYQVTNSAACQNAATALGLTFSAQSLCSTSYPKGCVAHPQLYPNPSMAYYNDCNYGNTCSSWGNNRPCIKSKLNTGIYGQRFNADGTKEGDEFSVSEGETDKQMPSVAHLGSGKFLVEWHTFPDEVTTAVKGSGTPSLYYNSAGCNAARIDLGYTWAGGISSNLYPYGCIKDSNNNVYHNSYETTHACGYNNYDCVEPLENSYGVYAQRYAADGTTEGSEFSVNTYTAGNQQHPSVAALDAGKFVVVWQSENQVSGSSNYDIYAQRYAVDGTKEGSEFLVNEHTTHAQEHPSVAGLPNGKFVVAWQSNLQDGSSYGVYAQRYAYQKQPIAGSMICTQCDSSLIRVGGDLFSDLAVKSCEACRSNEVPNADQGACVCADGHSVYVPVLYEKEGSETRANTYTTGTQEDPSVTFLSNGKSVVVWESHRGSTVVSSGARTISTSQADCQAYASNNGIPYYGTTSWSYQASGCITTGPTQVYYNTNSNTHNCGHNGWSCVEFDNSKNIYAQLYAADGTTEGDEFRVNTHIAGDQKEPSVAALDDGTFVVVWESDQYAEVSSGTADLSLSSSECQAAAPFFGYTWGRSDSWSTTFPTGCFTSGAQLFYNTYGGRTDCGAMVTNPYHPCVEARNGINAQLYAADGTKDGSEFQVNTYTSGDQHNPSVAHLGAGKFVVVWKSENQVSGSSEYDIYGQRFHRPITYEKGQCETVTGSYPPYYSTSCSGSSCDNCVPLCETYATAHNKPFAGCQKQNNGGFVTCYESCFQIDTNTGEMYPLTVVDPSKYDVVKDGSEFLVNTETSGTQGYFPSVAALDAGKFVVTWSSADVSGWGVYAQRYAANGTKDSTEFLVNTETSDSQLYPSVASVGNGKFVIAWQSYGQDGSQYGIHAQRYAADGTTEGSEFQVNNETSNTQEYASVAGLSDGSFVVAWHSGGGHDGGGKGIYAQAYHADGTLDGAEFQVNSESTNDQQKPSVAASPDATRFVVAWYSLHGSSSENIQLQRYSKGYGHCNACSAGTFRASGDSLVGSTTSCEACPVQTYSGAEAGSCTPWTTCAAGYYLAGSPDALQDGTCTPCAAGTYQPNADSVASSCDACPAGEHSAANASSCTAWAACAAGEFYTGTQISGEEHCQTHYVCSANSTEVMAPTSTSDRVCACEAGHSFSLAGLVEIRGETLVNTETTDRQEYASVAALDAGKYVVVWQSQNQVSGSSGWDIYGQRYAEDGTEEGDEFRVNFYTTNSQNSPSVAGLDAGKFVVVWESNGQDGSGNGVFTQRYRADGTKEGSEFRVNTHISSSQENPSVAHLGSGKFVIAWQSTDQHYAFVSSGSPSSSILTSACQSAASSLGYDWGGQVYWSGVPLYCVRTGTNMYYNTYNTGSNCGSGGYSCYKKGWATEIYGQRYAADGTKEGSEFMVNTHYDNNQYQPSVAALDAGKFVIAWQSENQDNSDYGIYAQRYAANGNKDGGEFRVNTYTTNSQRYPSVAALDAGKFVIVWQSDAQDGSSNGVYAQRYQADGTKDDSEFRVNTETSSNKWYPSVAGLDAGKFVVTWESSGQDGSSYGVYAQRYKADGTPEYKADGTTPDEFLVNTYTSGNQQYSSVAGLGANKFVVAWQSYTNSDWGVYQKLYEDRSTGCHACTAGTARPAGDLSNNSATTCAACAAGSFADSAAAATCTPYSEADCDKGLELVTSGKQAPLLTEDASCSACVEGKWQPLDSTTNLCQTHTNLFCDAVVTSGQPDNSMSQSQCQAYASSNSFTWGGIMDFYTHNGYPSGCIRRLESGGYGYEKVFYNTGGGNHPCSSDTVCITVSTTEVGNGTATADSTACVCKGGHNFVNAVPAQGVPKTSGDNLPYTSLSIDATQCQNALTAIESMGYSPAVWQGSHYDTSGNNPYGCYIYQSGSNWHVKWNSYIYASGHCSTSKPCYTGTMTTAILASCTPCGSGTYRAKGDPLGSATTCDACPAETYSTGTAAECSPWSLCAAGHYNSAPLATANSVCSVCPANTYSGTSSRLSACLAHRTECPTGEQLKAGTGNTTHDIECEACPAGTFQASTGAACATWRTTCDKGTQLESDGSASQDHSCSTCASGKFQPLDATADACADYRTSCPPGFALQDDGTAETDRTCQACSNTTFKDDHGNHSCTVFKSTCPAGTQLVLNGNTEKDHDCQLCPQGTYKEASGAEACAVCEAAKEVTPLNAVEGATGCVACVQATHMDSDGLSHTACEALNGTCPAGMGYLVTVATKPNLCLPCAAGSFQPNDNSKDTCAAHTITTCPAAQQLKAGTASTDSVCEACPSGTYKAGSGAEACLPWLYEVCALGYERTLAPSTTLDGNCSACAAGYFNNGKNAEACKAHRQICPAGFGLQAGTTEADASCVSCASGTFSTALDGGACVAHRSACAAGEALGTDGDASKDHSCTPCASGTYNTDGTTCLTHTNSSCPAGKGFTGSSTVDNLCSVCVNSYQPNAGSTAACKAWTTCDTSTEIESQVPSTTQDRVCACKEGHRFDKNTGACVACGVGLKRAAGDIKLVLAQ